MAKKGKEANWLEKSWKKELARDCIALGGIFFYALVVARVAMLQNWNYVFQFVFAAAVFVLFALIFKKNFKPDMYSGLGLILLVFVSLFYKDRQFTVFATLVYLLLLTSLFYLKTEKAKIFMGILAGAISTTIGYFIANLVF